MCLLVSQSISHNFVYTQPKGLTVQLLFEVKDEILP